jgi:hypothetical protein
MFQVKLGCLVSLNATKEYPNSPFHAAAYTAELSAGTTGRVIGIPHNDPDTFYIQVLNRRGHIIVAKREDFSIVKE